MCRSRCFRDTGSRVCCKLNSIPSKLIHWNSNPQSSNLSDIRRENLDIQRTSRDAHAQRKEKRPCEGTVRRWLTICEPRRWSLEHIICADTLTLYFIAYRTLRRSYYCLSHQSIIFCCCSPRKLVQSRITK